MFKILATIGLLDTTDAQITSENTWAKTVCDDQIEVFKCMTLKMASDSYEDTLDCEADYGMYGTLLGEEVTVAPASAASEYGQINDGYFTFAEF